LGDDTCVTAGSQFKTSDGISLKAAVVDELTD